MDQPPPTTPRSPPPSLPPLSPPPSPPPISVQPSPISSPSTAVQSSVHLPVSLQSEPLITSKPKKPAKPSKPSRDWQLRRRTHRITNVFSDVLTLLWIGLRASPVVILVAFGVIMCLVIPFAIAAANGAIMMLIGNGILHAARLPHYTDNASAAYIGAVGILIASLIVALVMQCVPSCTVYNQRTGEQEPAWYVTMTTTLVASTLAGTIGCAILLHNKVDIGGIDVLHATRAGALGGAILGPGSIITTPLIGAAVMIILSPLWLAVQMGVQWVSVRSNETWSDRYHSYSYCYCYGSRGDDPEINAELTRIPQHFR
ncbi:hypothetical protein B0H34DRAFT_806959 [Crassisporium funariophilum]|nr:hypothetical protein B0H34DRAFT_806959 [Crassisporium funariophilum]